MEQGYISIHRKIAENPIWKKKPFSYGQAWIDLILVANHKDNKIIFNGEIITVARGSFITSQEKLKKKWGWKRNYFDNFISILKSNEMILAQNRANQGTYVTICNYESYQNAQQTKGQTEGHTVNKRSTNGGAINNNDNNENNENNENNTFKIGKQTQKFKAEILSFKANYPDKLLEAFFEFWSEPNGSRTKMRYQMQKTWDLGRRLKRWANNDKNFKNQKEVDIYQGIKTV